MTENFKQMEKVDGRSSEPMSLQERAWEIVLEYRKSLQHVSIGQSSYEKLLQELKEREPVNTREYLVKILISYRDELITFIYSKRKKPVQGHLAGGGSNFVETNLYALYDIIFYHFIDSLKDKPPLLISNNFSELLKETATTIDEYSHTYRNRLLESNSIDFYHGELGDYKSYIDYRFSQSNADISGLPIDTFFKEATVLSHDPKVLPLQTNIESLTYRIETFKCAHQKLFFTYLAILHTNSSVKNLAKQKIISGDKIPSILDKIIYDLLMSKPQQKSETFALPLLSFSKYPELLKATKHIFNAQIRKYSTLAENSPTDVPLQITKEEQDEKLKLHKQKPLLRRIVNFLEMKEEKLNITTSQRETIEKLLTSLNSIVTLWNIGHTYAEKSEFEDQRDYGRFLMASAKLVLDGLRRNLINLEIALQNKDISYEFASLDQDLAGIEDKLRADQNVAIGLLDGLRTSLEINNKISSEGNS